MRDRWLIAALLLALVLRAWPLHVPYLNPDQGNVPQFAVTSVFVGDWRPARLEYPSGVLYVHRAAYTIAYGIGYALGRFTDRLDLIASWLENPFPWLLVGRIFACLCGVANVALAARLATQLGGPRCGPLAALFLAVAFLHVRESHYGTGDVPGAAFFTATLVAAETYRARGGLSRFALAAALAGLTAAFRYPLAVVALAVPTAHLLRPEGRTLRGVLALPLAGVVAVGAFALLSPYTLFEAGRAWRDLRGELAWAYNWVGPSPLPLATILLAGSGTVLCALAVVGLVTTGVGTLTVLVPSVPLTIALLRAGRLFARYSLPLVPLIAVFAACAIERTCRRLPHRLATTLRVGLVLVAIADPAARSLAAVDLLARDDTRQEAGRWLTAHVQPGDTLFLPLPRTYVNPVMKPARDVVFAAFGYEILVELAKRRRAGLPQTYAVAYYAPSDDPEKLMHGGGWVVTADHPYLPQWAYLTPVILSLVQRHGQPVARFVGVPAGGGGGLYEPVDANFLPLRGLTSIARPGPNLTVWRLTPWTPAGR